MCDEAVYTTPPAPHRERGRQGLCGIPRHIACGFFPTNGKECDSGNRTVPFRASLVAGGIRQRLDFGRVRFGCMPTLRMLGQIRAIDEVQELARRSQTIGSAIFLRSAPFASSTHPTHVTIVRFVPSRVRCLRVSHPGSGLSTGSRSDVHARVFLPVRQPVWGMLFFVFTPFAI